MLYQCQDKRGTLAYYTTPTAYEGKNTEVKRFTISYYRPHSQGPRLERFPDVSVRVGQVFLQFVLVFIL